jgi:leucyl/phenylalanyl-tRNA--protein transferase
MADERGRIDFYCADPRAILPLDEFHCPRRVARIVRQGRFEVRVDSAVEATIRGCMTARARTWISEEIVQAYVELHRRGQVHSVEAWFEGELAGGLYGVTLGGAFCGESMFTRVSEASKVCVVHLVERLRERGYALLDCQQLTAHTKRFGARLIGLGEYRRLLKAALARECTFV